MRLLLTDGFLRSAKPPARGRVEYADTRSVGLVFRIAASGGRVWSFRFRDRAGKQTRATIGTYPAVGLKAARIKAAAMRAVVADGGNPVERKREARAGAGTKTFAALAARYLAEHAERTPADASRTDAARPRSRSRAKGSPSR
jgi:hypothetical protein